MQGAYGGYSGGVMNFCPTCGARTNKAGYDKLDSPKSKDDFRAESLIRAGLTGHTDLGIIDDFYCDLIFLGPFNKTIRLQRELIDISPDPSRTRLELLRTEIAIWYDELKK